MYRKIMIWLIFNIKLLRFLVNVSGTTVPFINTEMRLNFHQILAIFFSTWSCQFVFYYLGIFLQQLRVYYTLCKMVLTLAVYGGVPRLQISKASFIQRIWSSLYTWLCSITWSVTVEIWTVLWLKVKYHIHLFWV